MSQGSSQLHQPPAVDASGIFARARLEAELFGLDEQMRTFDRIRDRFTAEGQDPLAFYRKLQARRGELVTALRASRSGSMTAVEAERPVASIDEPLLTRPIAAATFNSKLGGFGFGTSGYVQVGPASELSNKVGASPGGQYPQYGTIDTDPGAPAGEVRFKGRLIAGPEELNGVLDPIPYYAWEHSWSYSVPFPRPTVPSWLTYRFDAIARLGFIAIAEGAVIAFVALAETQDITAGSVTPNIFNPVLVTANLGAPSPNGAGILSGQQTVQRSFLVSPDYVPGIVVVVGVNVAMDMWSDLNFYYPMESGRSYIRISSQNWTGRVAYSEEPQQIFHPEP
jgi:hypothetical protein